MKVTNVLKNVGVGVLVTMLVGCASVDSVTNKMVNNTQGGVIFGTGAVDTTANVSDVCRSINNKDSRCNESDDYSLIVVIAKAGYADGAVGINALIKKDSEFIKALTHQKRLGDKTMPYVKAKVIPGQLGELLEIVSTNGDGKCVWSGLPRIGGTVCPAYNYDYRKDFIGVVFR